MKFLNFSALHMRLFFTQQVSALAHDTPHFKIRIVHTKRARDFVGGK